MIRSMRKVIGVVAVAVLALGVAAVAVAAKNKPPATGDYTADLEVNGSYQQGGWTVTKEGGKRQLVCQTIEADNCEVPPAGRELHALPQLTRTGAGPGFHHVVHHVIGPAANDPRTP